MSRVTRGVRGSRGNIDAPLCYGDVADVVDPEFGPSEIPPAPGIDPVGTVYSVGPERERWELVGGGALTWLIRGPDGRTLGRRPANELLMKRGARIMYLPNHWLPPMARAHLGAPLVHVEGQATLFGTRAA